MKYKETVLFSFLPGIILVATIGAKNLKIATVAPSGVIKGGSSAVYYLGNDGKRYVFPNDKVYFSWYSDFSEVQTVSDDVLAPYSLGGNVTYRPGTHLVKIQSDPKVYAVDKGGVLRWINSESAAITIFGSNWNKQVDDIPDAFFINYTIGNPVSSASDYDPTIITSNDTSINLDKNLIANLTTIPTPNSTTIPIKSAGVVALSSEYNYLHTSQMSADISVGARDTNGIASVMIYVNGLATKTCQSSFTQTGGNINYPTSIASNTCTTTLYGSDYANGSDVSVYALETDRYGNTATSATTILTMQKGTTSGSGSVTLSFAPYASKLSSGQSTTMTASAADANGITSIIIYANGLIAQTCSIANDPVIATCAMNLSASNYIDGSIVNIYAQEFDREGNASSSLTSNITISKTEHLTGT